LTVVQKFNVKNVLGGMMSAYDHEEFWRDIIAQEILISCPDIAEWGEECPDCSEVSKFVRQNRTGI
jgi:hypothetical protein